MEDAATSGARGFDPSAKEWSHLRTHLDSPIHSLGRRLGSSLTEWLQRRWTGTAPTRPALSVLARIPLGPRQFVALLEAEGTHLLVATSGDAAPSFYSLQQAPGATPASMLCAACGEPCHSAAGRRPAERASFQQLLVSGKGGRRPGFQSRVSW